MDGGLWGWVDERDGLDRGFMRSIFSWWRRWVRRLLGFVLLGGCLRLGWGGEVLTVLFKIQEGVAELPIEGGLVAAEEFEAIDVEAIG